MVRAVERALNILEALTNNKAEPKGITELSKEVGMGKSTVHRLLMTLQARGYVEKETEGDKYHLGLKILELGGILKNNLDLQALARPLLKKLVESVGITVHLAIQSDDEIVYIDKVESNSSIQMASYIGQRSFLHSTALGKAICAYLPPAEVAKHLTHKGMPAKTANTITSLEAFVEHLEVIRQNGYAVDNIENEESIRCVAAPIFDQRGKVIAALSVSGTILQVAEDKVPEIALRDVATAREISCKMGYREGV